MSKFKKSLKRTTKNLKGSGYIAIYPILGAGKMALEMSNDSDTPKLGNKNIGYTATVIGLGILWSPVLVIAVGACLPFGSLCGIVCTLAGAVDIGYGGCYDVIHYLSKEEARNLEAPVNEEVGSHANMMKALKVEANLSNEVFSQYTQSYLDGFQNKILFATTLKKLNLTQEEWALFENYLDPITQELIEIPVLLNEQAYDYASILQMLSTKSVDPIKNIPFIARDISPNRQMYFEIEKIIETLITNRQKVKQETVQVLALPLEESDTQTLQLI